MPRRRADLAVAPALRGPRPAFVQPIAAEIGSAAGTRAISRVSTPSRQTPSGASAYRHRRGPMPLPAARNTLTNYQQSLSVSGGARRDDRARRGGQAMPPLNCARPARLPGKPAPTPAAGPVTALAVAAAARLPVRNS